MKLHHHRLELQASSFGDLVAFHHALVDEYGLTSRFRVALTNGKEEWFDTQAGLKANLRRLIARTPVLREIELPPSMAYQPENLVSFDGLQVLVTRQWPFIEEVLALWEDLFGELPALELVGKGELDKPDGQEDDCVGTYLNVLSILLFRYGALDDGLPRDGIRVAARHNKLMLRVRNKFRLAPDRDLYYDPTLLPGLRQRVPLVDLMGLTGLEGEEQECRFDLARQLCLLRATRPIRYEVMQDLVEELTRPLE